MRKKHIAQGDIFTQSMLQDIGALVSYVEQEAALGTHRYWHGDECHIEGGWVETYRDDRANALTTGASSLRRLYEAIAQVNDIRLAYATAKALVIES